MSVTELTLGRLIWNTELARGVTNSSRAWKIEIYHLKQLGWTWSQLSPKFDVNKVHLQYLVRLIDKYGLDCIQKDKNNYYSPELKAKIINELLLRGRSQLDMSLDDALPSRSTLPTWIVQYKKNRYTILEKARGRGAKMGRKPKKTWEEMTELDRLQEENERLRTEVAFLKKLRELEKRDEAIERERQKQFERWSKEDSD